MCPQGIGMSSWGVWVLWARPRRGSGGEMATKVLGSWSSSAVSVSRNLLLRASEVSSSAPARPDASYARRTTRAPARARTPRCSSCTASTVFERAAARIRCAHPCPVSAHSS